MRKRFIWILIIIFVFLQVGCSQESKTSSNEKVTETVEEDNQNENEDSKLNDSIINTDNVLTTNGGETIELSQLEHLSQDSTKPVVYFTNDISPEALINIYNQLGFTPEGKVAVKLSTGESENSNYLKPELIKDLVKNVNGTIVECNTAYGGNRSSTDRHYQIAEDRGYTGIADFVVLDEDGSESLPVSEGDHLSEDLVGQHFNDYGSYLVLSHFKGHTMAGFGGAIKNISIGLASSEGKSLIHSGGKTTSGFGGDQDAFLESMAEAANTVNEAKKLTYINIMNRLSVDCDCDGNPAEPDMHDIGILASNDPVALDQACIDLVSASEEGGSLMERINSRNGLLTLEHANEIGLGSREYQLNNLTEGI